MGQKHLFLGLILSCFYNVSWAHLNPPQIIALMPPDSGEVLERENQIEVLCPKTKPDFEKCKSTTLQPVKWFLKAHEGPSVNSKILGQLLIKATPGQGMQAFYKPEGQKAVLFKEDSNGTDWGYSSYFEFTVSNVKDTWIQLPKRPFSKPVWINPELEWSKLKKTEHSLIPTPNALGTDSVYSSKNLGSFVFTEFKDKTVKIRKEIPSDMPCSDEVELPEEEIQKKKDAEPSVTHPIESLFDKDGHLLVWPSYPRGC